MALNMREEGINELKTDTTLEQRMLSETNAKWHRIKWAMILFSVVLALSLFLLMVNQKEAGFLGGCICGAILLILAAYGLKPANAYCPICEDKMSRMDGKRVGLDWEIVVVCRKCKIKARTGEYSGGPS
jgi:hypothetical protein